MAILIDETTTVVIQGITGKQGSAATQEMLAYGTRVLCGVTPGKGGQTVQGIPVYNTLKDACAKHPVTASVVYVPPFNAKQAIFEAIDSGISLILIVTEGIPLHDTAKILQHAKKKGTRIIGPGSVGIISPGKVKLGSVAGFDRAFTSGNIGLISKSGGMTSETALLLSLSGFGQSTAVCIGGDVLLGSSFADLLALFEKDKETKAIVLFGEVGGTYEEEAAEFIKQGGCTKPVIAYVSGKFAPLFPSIPLGHAGAIIEGNKGTRESKVKSLKSANVSVAEVHHELVSLVRERLKA